MGKRKRSGSFSKYDDCSKKSDDGDSQEELDGDSVSVQKGNIINGIRYSARVQEKQEKLRREASPSKQIVIEAPSTSSIPLPCPTSSINITTEDPIFDFPFASSFLSRSISSSLVEKKKKRTWELWSQEDKQLFFEALNEFGKDFDAIQTHLASKLKPRSKTSCPPVPKNKDQVRHFYYRTWNKISKHLTFPKDMKKMYQELYGLINYGELRKKQRVLNMKTAVKLSELVERGTTTIKVRGKTFRIKTPVCRALKKLNQLEDTDQLRVPCKLCVELIPHDGNTWASVQGVSHNPRVKVYVPLQRTLSSLILYFEERWKTDHNRLKEEFSLTMFGKPRSRLRFIPVESRDLSVPIFKFSEITSATKISLTSYVQNCLYQEEGKGDSILVSKKFKPKPKLDDEMGFCSGNLGGREPDPADADVSDADGCEGMSDNQFKITLRKDRFLCQATVGNTRHEFYTDQENSNGFPDNAMWSVHEENANAAADTDIGETDYGYDENIASPTECDDNDNSDDDDQQDNIIMYRLHHDSESREEKQGPCAACKSPEGEDCTSAEKLDRLCTCGGKKNNDPIGTVDCPSFDIETLAKGWTAEEAKALTVGEIYLMLGKCDRLCFEYVWDKCEEDRIREERAQRLVDKLISVARHLKKRKTNRAKTTVSVATNVSVSGTHSHLCTKCSLPCESSTQLNNFDCESIAITSVPFTTPTKELGDTSPVETSPLSESGFSQEAPEEGIQSCSNAILSESPPAEAEPTPAAAVEPVVSNEILVEPVPTTETSNKPIPKLWEAVEDSSITLNSEEVDETIDISATTEEENNSVQIISDQNQSALSASVRQEPIDSIIVTTSEPALVTTTATMVSIPSTISTQTGLINLTTLATNSPTCTELESSFIRTASNITATILPPPSTIIHSVQLTNSGIHEARTTTLCNTATTTVLVSEPAIFAGLTAEAPSFVTIQPCNPATVASSPSTSQKVQHEPKFRRPLLIKPSTQDPKRIEDTLNRMMDVPKPFLDLPKGNRRIGRRPAWKQRVIIPRMLPLLPKPDDTVLKPMATLIPVVATGLGVVPVSAENFTSVTTLPTFTDPDINTTSSPLPALPSSATVVTSSVVHAPTSSTSSTDQSIEASGSTVNNNIVLGASINSAKTSSTPEKNSGSTDKLPAPSKNTSDANLPSSSRTHGSGFDETLDNLSLSSFMDISIPESTRFIASDLRLEELECSNASIGLSLSGMLEDSNRKNLRDPPLLDTPKKQAGGDEEQLQIPSPPARLSSQDISWPAMNEQSSDLFMGGIFSANETLRPSTEPLGEGDLNFQSVMGENSLDFESKLRDFSVHITDSNKK